MNYYEKNLEVFLIYYAKLVGQICLGNMSFCLVLACYLVFYNDLCNTIVNV